VMTGLSMMASGEKQVPHRRSLTGASGFGMTKTEMPATGSEAENRKQKKRDAASGTD